MSKNGIAPNVVTFNSMINGFCQAGDVKKAEDLINKMIAAGLVPNIITFNTFIHTHCKEENMSEAFRMFHKMEEFGVMPDITTYNAFINGLCRRGNMQEAKAVFEKIQQKGLVPNKSTYTTLIDGYFNEKNDKEAFKLHVEMLQRGFVPGSRYPQHGTEKGWQRKARAHRENIKLSRDVADMAKPCRICNSFSSLVFLPLLVAQNQEVIDRPCRGFVRPMSRPSIDSRQTLRVCFGYGSWSELNRLSWGRRKEESCFGDSYAFFGEEDFWLHYLESGKEEN